MRYDQFRSRARYEDGPRTFTRWISTRPFESWGFFIAGFVLARIIF
jgi:hypothetical protein